jgi:ribosomal protein L29
MVRDPGRMDDARRVVARALDFKRERLAEID